jgi:hypothetical protein
MCIGSGVKGGLGVLKGAHVHVLRAPASGAPGFERLRSPPTPGTALGYDLRAAGLRRSRHNRSTTSGASSKATSTPVSRGGFENDEPQTVVCSRGWQGLTETDPAGGALPPRTMKHEGHGTSAALVMCITRVDSEEPKCMTTPITAPLTKIRLTVG